MAAHDLPAPRRFVGLLVLLAALLIAGLVLVPRDPEEIRDAVDGAGVALAPVAFMAAGALLTVAFFPFPVTAAAGGLLFGVAAGTVLSVVAETLGAVAALMLARHGARDTAMRLAGPRLAAVLRGVTRRGFSAVLLVRVVPGVPRHPANYAFGLTAVGLPAFVAARALGTAPRALGYAALGGTLGDLTSPNGAAEGHSPTSVPHADSAVHESSESGHGPSVDRTYNVGRLGNGVARNTAGHARRGGHAGRRHGAARCARRHCR